MTTTDTAVVDELIEAQRLVVLLTDALDHYLNRTHGDATAEAKDAIEQGRAWQASLA